MSHVRGRGGLVSVRAVQRTDGRIACPSCFVPYLRGGGGGAAAVVGRNREGEEDDFGGSSGRRAGADVRDRPGFPSLECTRDVAGRGQVGRARSTPLDRGPAEDAEIGRDENGSPTNGGGGQGGHRGFRGRCV